MTESSISAATNGSALSQTAPETPPTVTPPGASPNPSPESHPKAVVIESNSSGAISRLWWLTGLSLIVAIALALNSAWRQGPRITIHFVDGHGLKAGDVLRYRGISVGQVTDVAMTPKRDGVVCTVVLDHEAESIARRGSEFWIERPQISLSRVSGLETVVGGKHLGVRPGPVDGPPAHQFEGIESPPTLIEADFTDITIRFADGHGLRTGDSVRHRGIVIGEVTGVDLESDLSVVTVKVRLSGMARQVAREGSQFWVERPSVAITEVRGLETIVGGRYLAVSPGTEDAAICATFTGLEAAPAVEIPAGAIEILLHAPQRWGIDRGVPITYRGLRVGQVHSVGLSSDGTRVEARASIESKYRSLVRKNSVFWSASGVDFGFGFTGMQFSAETLATIAQGGVAFATPDAATEPASSGQRFPFERRAPDAVADWNPHIDMHQGERPGLGSPPEPQRAVVRWTERTFGFRRNFERSSWVILLDDRKLLAPADVLIPSEHPVDDVSLEVAGLRVKLEPAQIERNGLLAKSALPDSLPDGMSTWPTKRIRRTTEPEDVLVFIDSQAAPHPIAASSQKLVDGMWELHNESGLNPTCHGAPVVAAKDGQLIGMLAFRRGKPLIVPVGSP